MAVDVEMTVDNSTPDHGDTITVTYEVTGNDPTDPAQATISGRVVIAGVTYDVENTITIPGTDAGEVTYETPKCEGLEFDSTDQDNVFTSVVP